MEKMFWHDLDFNFIEFQKALFEFVNTNDGPTFNQDEFFIDFEKFADAIRDEIVVDKIVVPLGKVVDVDLDTFQVGMTTDHPDDVGHVFWHSFPFDFISRCSFQDLKLQEYVTSTIELIKANWALGASLCNPESAYALAMCEMLKNNEADILKAANYCLQAADEGYGYAQASLLCICLDALHHDIDIEVDIINVAVKYAEELYASGDMISGYYLGFYYFYKMDFAISMEYFIKVMDSDDLSLVMKESIAKLIAPLYKDGLKDGNGNIVVHRNFYTAKKYYEMVNRKGEYSADIEYLNCQLGIHNNENQMQLFAKEILSINPNISGRELYKCVVEDLKNEFGSYWICLPKSSQQDLISGCHVYITLFSLGADLYKNIDFSSAIIPIVKSCEIVFRQYISTSYYDYLVSKDIPPTALNKKHPFTEYNKLLNKVVYKVKDKIEFTMGSIRWIIDLQSGSYGGKTISSHFLDYACGLFGVDKEDRARRNQVEKYFVSLATQMNQFTFNIRNPAAHTEIMPIWQAEICGNEIIKVRKVLKDFMEHICLDNNE